MTLSAGAQGNVAPISAIGGSNTGLDSPHGVSLDAVRNIYVANPGFCQSGCQNRNVSVYAAGANGDVAPMRSVKGSKTGLIGPVGIALDARQNVYVADSGGNGVLVYAAGGNGNVPPSRTISGSHTGLNNPLGIVLDGANGDVPPMRTIGGSKTGLAGPSGIALR
jgi:hypothetical protein